MSFVNTQLFAGLIFASPIKIESKVSLATLPLSSVLEDSLFKKAFFFVWFLNFGQS